MRIDKIEIDGFGKLNNKEFVFADGVNLIYGENESGKSTLCEFLLSAFYGLPTESKKEIIDMPTRQKYRPWNTENYGGRVYFTDDNGKKYVIERTFKTTPRSDKSVLRDADTWEELDSGEDLGEKFFGLSRKAFLKTLYVRSFGADSLKTDDGEILSRLSNLETAGDEDISYSKIINAMEKEIFHLRTKTGRGGKITETEDKLNALNQEKSLSKLTYNALENDEKYAETLKKESEEKEKQAKTFEEKYNVALSYEKYKNSQKTLEVKATIKSRIEKEEEKLTQIEEELKNIKDEPQKTVSVDDIGRARALETKKLLTEETLNKTNKPSSKSIGGILSLLIGGVLGLIMVFSGKFYIFLSGMLMIVAGLCLFALFTKKIRRKQSEYLAIQKEIETINSELASIYEHYGVSVSDELSAIYMNFSNRDETKKELEKKREECIKEIESFVKSIPDESDEEFSEEVMNYNGETADELYKKITLLREDSKKAAEKASDITVRLTRETAEIRPEEDIEAEITTLTEELQTLTARHSSLTKAAEWLVRAHNEIKNNFAPRLNEKASDYLKYLTYEKYKDVRTTDTFGINVKGTDGNAVEAEYMSRGTYDLMYIALRFAAMNVLSDGKIPPVILDDAFSQLDDKRLEQAMSLLKNTPEFSQVLYFTCHNNYEKFNDNINIIKL